MPQVSFRWGALISSQTQPDVTLRWANHRRHKHYCCLCRHYKYRLLLQRWEWKVFMFYCERWLTWHVWWNRCCHMHSRCTNIQKSAKLPSFYYVAKRLKRRAARRQQGKKTLQSCCGWRKPVWMSRCSRAKSEITGRGYDWIFFVLLVGKKGKKKNLETLWWWCWWHHLNGIERGPPIEQYVHTYKHAWMASREKILDWMYFMTWIRNLETL